MKYVSVVVLLLFFFNASIAQKVKPALNLKKGSTYYMISNANSTIVQTLNSQENTLNLTFVFKMAFKVIDVLDTTYNMEVSYQAINMKIQAGTQSVEIDNFNLDLYCVQNNEFLTTITPLNQSSPATVVWVVDQSFTSLTANCSAMVSLKHNNLAWPEEGKW